MRNAQATLPIKVSQVCNITPRHSIGSVAPTFFFTAGTQVAAPNGPPSSTVAAVAPEPAQLAALSEGQHSARSSSSKYGVIIGGAAGELLSPPGCYGHPEALQASAELKIAAGCILDMYDGSTSHSASVV